MADAGNGIDMAAGVSGKVGVSDGEGSSFVADGIMIECQAVGIEREASFMGLGIVGVLEQFVDEMGVVLVPVGNHAADAGKVRVVEDFGVPAAVLG